jgi:hypothetical protein
MAWRQIGTLVAMAVLSAGGAAFAAEEVRVGSDRGPDLRADRALAAPAGLAAVHEGAVADLAVRAELVPSPDLAAIRAEDARNDAVLGATPRVGVNLAIPGGALTPDNSGQWDLLPDGSEVWTLRVVTEGAQAVRPHFTRFVLPEGSSVVVRGVEGDTTVYDGRGPGRHGAFWAAPAMGAETLIQYRAPAGTVDAPIIEIAEVGHLYRLRAPVVEAQERPGDDRVDQPCHVDAQCFLGGDPALQNYSDAVCLLFFPSGGGQGQCTGTLLNDADPNTFAGYVLTANHCFGTGSQANNLVAYFNYRSTACDSGVAPSLSTLPRLIGADLISSSSLNDHTFVRMDEDPGFGPGFAAWTSTPIAVSGADVLGIHHPSGEYQRISSGQTTTNAPLCTSTSTFYHGDWIYLGIQEGGSSGSSIVNFNYEVVGQLLGSCFFTGNPPSCGNIPGGWNWMYGRFDYTYNNFPAVATALQSVATEDQYEDNDELSAAAPLALGVYDLHLVDFDDYFEVTVACDTTLRARAEYDFNDMDLDLYIYDASGAVIAQNLGFGSKTAQVAVTAGTYRVRAAKDFGWGGPYELELSTTPSCFPTFDGVCCFGCDPAPSPDCPDASGAIAAETCFDANPEDCVAAGGTYRDGLACDDAIDPCQCPGDLNGDGVVDVFDFGDMSSNFGSGEVSCATRAQGDLNCDGVIDVFDFGELSAGFGCDSN